jgi:hypothetical protein
LRRHLLNSLRDAGIITPCAAIRNYPPSNHPTRLAFAVGRRIMDVTGGLKI